MPIQLPDSDPCELCEGLAGRLEDWLLVDESELTATLLLDMQFEVGQVLVFPKRHAPTLLDLTGAEAIEVIAAARRIAAAMVGGLDPDGILLYQNNGVASGQATPHFHLHVVPRQPGSDWGLGPPQLAHFDEAERLARRARIRKPIEERLKTAALFKPFLEGANPQA